MDPVCDRASLQTVDASYWSTCQPAPSRPSRWLLEGVRELWSVWWRTVLGRLNRVPDVSMESGDFADQSATRARAKAAMVIGGIGAVLILAVVWGMLRGPLTVAVIYRGGYLLAAGLAAFGVAGPMIARRAPWRRWWFGVLTLAGIVFFATWVYVVIHSAEVQVLVGHRLRGGSEPWVAGVLFGTLSLVRGVVGLRHPEYVPPSPDGRVGRSAARRRARGQLGPSLIILGAAVALLAGVSAALSPSTATQLAGFFAAGCGGAVAFSGLWVLGRARAVRQAGLVFSGLVMLATAGFSIFGPAPVVADYYPLAVAGAAFAVLVLVVGLFFAGASTTPVSLGSKADSVPVVGEQASSATE